MVGDLPPQDKDSKQTALEAQGRPAHRLAVRLSKRPLGWLLAIYWTALFLGTHVPVPSGVLKQGSDKVIHFLAYAGLAFLLSLWRGPAKWRTSLVILAVFAVVDEVLQIPVGRTCDLHDMIADWLGSAFGAAAAWLVVRHAGRK